MIYAEMHGKMHCEEDILTSSAIGLLTLFPDDLFIGFLGTAKNAKDLKRQRLQDQISKFSRVKNVEYWKTGFPNGSIPDVLIELTNEDNTRHCAIVVEVKHRSGKSGEAFETEDGKIEKREDDQIYKYWYELVLQYPLSEKALVFLTGDRTVPEKSLSISLKASNGEAQLYWLSWYDLYFFVLRCLESGKYPECSTECKIMQLLKCYLQFKGYEKFCGWPKLANVTGEGSPLLLWYKKLYAVNFNIINIPGLEYRKIYKWEKRSRWEKEGTAFYKQRYIDLLKISRLGSDIQWGFYKSSSSI